jgi:hypothetical protein
MTTFARAILAATALWHAAGAWHFLFYPERTLRRTTDERPANRNAVELFRFLGGLNAALVPFALLTMLLPDSLLWIALVGFSLVNFSQFALDLRLARLKLARGALFKSITWGDGLFFAANAIAAAWIAAATPR